MLSLSVPVTTLPFLNRCLLIELIRRILDHLFKSLKMMLILSRSRESWIIEWMNVNLNSISKHNLSLVLLSNPLVSLLQTLNHIIHKLRTVFNNNNHIYQNHTIHFIKID